MKKQLDISKIPMLSPILVISVGDWNEANLITLAWVARVVSKPPIMSVSIRPSRYSFTLIEKLNEFIINIPNSDLIKEMDFCGTRTGEKTDKWNSLQLTKQKAKFVEVPMIKEFPINIECSVFKKVKYGTHVVFLGEVLAVHVEGTLLKNGGIDPQKIDQIAYIAQHYYGLKEVPLEKQDFTVGIR